SPSETSFDRRFQTGDQPMSTKVASDRKLRVEEILAAFGMKAGGTVTGLAYGGSFRDDASGAPIETRDPSTGEVLARVQTASADDRAHGTHMMRRNASLRRRDHREPRTHTQTDTVSTEPMDRHRGTAVRPQRNRRPRGRSNHHSPSRREKLAQQSGIRRGHRH